MRHPWWMASLAVLQLGCVAGVLVGSASWLSTARRDVARAQQDLAGVELSLAAQKQQQDRIALRERLLQRVRESGLAPAQWAERRLNVQQVALSREAAREVLGDIARAKGKMFYAEQFDLVVSRPDEDLFTPPPSTSAPALVTLSLRGRLFSQEGR